MKKLLTFIVMFLMFCIPVFAQTNPSVNFDGKAYVLKYSAKMQTGSYMNEYYLPAEKYGNWTKLIGVFDYPQMKDPINGAAIFLNSVKSKNTPGEMWVNKDKNSAVVSFIVITGGGNSPLKSEINFFRYEKSAKNGTIALQYAERYVIKTDAEYEEYKKNLRDRVLKFTRLMTTAPMPELVERDVDLGK